VIWDLPYYNPTTPALTATIVASRVMVWTVLICRYWLWQWFALGKADRPLLL